MNFSCTRHLRLTAIGIVALAAGSLVACSPEPEPTPTPTAAFASEEEAFDAAEEVYRAYLIAEDAMGNEDPGEDPQSYLTGQALKDTAAAQQAFDEDGVRIVGTTTLQSFEGATADVEASVAKLVAIACIDVSESRVLDSSGSDITPVDRDTSWPLEVTFVGDRSSLLISESLTTESAGC
ncbi:hypothetical protein [Microbacterium sp. NPDC056234]|uniref:hypothetical protein n=1 Tax=Microbacterium sp. NPDC056234 TaxID=3345757 RepID=UPI0035DBE742